MSHNSAPRSNDAPSCSPRRLWPTRSERRWLWLLLAAGLVLRIGVMVAFRTYDIPANSNHFYFGAEYGRIARSLAVGKGYSSPFHLDRGGPTTKGCPLFPFYLSLLFRLFGVYTPQAAAALYLSNSVAILASAFMAFIVGKRLFGPPVGWVAAALMTFEPATVWYSANCTWETAFSCAAITALVVAFLWLRSRPTGWAGAKVGLVLGLASHMRAEALLVGVACAVWLLVRASGHRRAALRSVVAMGIVCAAAITPWSVRNSLIEGSPVILRGHASAFLQSAQRPGKEVSREEGVARYFATHALQEKLGDAEYLRVATERFRERPRIGLGQYLRDVGVRSTRFWIGEFWSKADWLGGAHVTRRFRLKHVKIVLHALPTVLALIGFAIAWRRRQDVWLLFAQVAGFFPVYAFVHCSQTRYRFPIHTALMLLSSVTLVSLACWAHRRWRRGALRTRSSRDGGPPSRTTSA